MLEWRKCEQQQSDFLPIIAYTKSVALLFATKQANKKRGLLLWRRQRTEAALLQVSTAQSSTRLKSFSGADGDTLEQEEEEEEDEGEEKKEEEKEEEE